MFFETMEVLPYVDLIIIRKKNMNFTMQTHLLT